MTTSKAPVDIERKKIVYIISDIEKALAFEWIAQKIDTQKIDLSFILLNERESALERFLSRSYKTFRLSHRSKLGRLREVIGVYRVLRSIRPDGIHCHMRRANFAGLIAAFFAGVTMRVHTRHSATFNARYHPHAVKYDRIVNKLSTQIVAISDNVHEVLLNDEGVPSSKIRTIHHGFDLDSFLQKDERRINTLRQKWNIEDGRLVVGVIARWFELKGIHYIVPAFKRLVESYPNALLILANATGPYESTIERLLSELPDGSYRIIDFEADLQSLYQLMDMYVHVPIDPQIEAFGQTYVEALASGVPSIFTLSGVAKEFIVDTENALVVPFSSSTDIYDNMIKLQKDKSLCQRLITNGLSSIEHFNIQRFVDDLESLYCEHA